MQPGVGVGSGGIPSAIVTWWDGLQGLGLVLVQVSRRCLPVHRALRVPVSSPMEKLIPRTTTGFKYPAGGAEIPNRGFLSPPFSLQSFGLLCKKGSTYFL